MVLSLFLLLLQTLHIKPTPHHHHEQRHYWYLQYYLCLNEGNVLYCTSEIIEEHDDGAVPS